MLGEAVSLQRGCNSSVGFISRLHLSHCSPLASCTAPVGWAITCRAWLRKLAAPDKQLCGVQQLPASLALGPHAPCKDRVCMHLLQLLRMQLSVHRHSWQRWTKTYCKQAGSAHSRLVLAARTTGLLTMGPAV